MQARAYKQIDIHDDLRDVLQGVTFIENGVLDHPVIFWEPGSDAIERLDIHKKLMNIMNIKECVRK